MNIKFSRDKIELKKELNNLDKFTLDFTSILNKLNINYVIISGYVSIIFGRNRASEDIDIFIEKLNLKKFKELWNELYKQFECLNNEDLKVAYKEYLLNNIALRFSKKKNYIPNMELKFPKNELDIWTIENKKKVILNNKILFISPLELQIPFKLFLGSEKDIEDAKYLYRLFKDKININLLKEFNRKLNIEALFNKYLR
tara:strand:- start:70 stop:669 length:600 start_codon:yes stop_codon:yes gene_type:complete